MWPSRAKNLLTHHPSVVTSTKIILWTSDSGGEDKYCDGALVLPSQVCCCLLCLPFSSGCQTMAEIHGKSGELTPTRTSILVSAPVLLWINCLFKLNGWDAARAWQKSNDVMFFQVQTETTSERPHDTDSIHSKESSSDCCPEQRKESKKND